jgi:hypothetical protein
VYWKRRRRGEERGRREVSVCTKQEFYIEMNNGRRLGRSAFRVKIKLECHFHIKNLRRMWAANSTAAVTQSHDPYYLK